jgi:hypothetical protein
MFEETSLHCFLGTKVCEQAALGHAGVRGQHAERDAFQPGLARHGKTGIEDAIATRHRFPHTERLARRLRLGAPARNQMAIKESKMTRPNEEAGM